MTNDITCLASHLANVRFFCPHCTIPRERRRGAKYIWAPESWRQSQSASQGVRRQVHPRHEGPVAPQVLQGLQTQPWISKPGTRVGVVAVRANSFDYLGLWHRSKWPRGDRGGPSLKILPQKQGAWNLINKRLYNFLPEDFKNFEHRCNNATHTCLELNGTLFPWSCFGTKWHC